MDGLSYVDVLGHWGVVEVFSFPSVSIDAELEQLAVAQCIRVHIMRSEESAAWAATGCAELSGRPTCVFLDAEFSLAPISSALQRATAHCLPVVVVVEGGTSSSRPRPHLVIPNVDVLALVDAASAFAPTGPTVILGSSVPDNFITSHHVDSSRPDHRNRVARASSDRIVALLPARGTATRNAVLASGLPFVTTTGVEPAARSHGERWLGRVGFLPSASAYALLASPGVTLAAEPDAVVPEWIGCEVLSSDLGQLASLATPDASPWWGCESEGVPADGCSPLASVTRALANALPTAVFVADAGASHRVVARWAANEGRLSIVDDGLTLMGSALPSALGAGVADPEVPVVVVMGDGAAAVSGSDLAWLPRMAPRTVVVLAVNGTLGARGDGSPLGVLAALPPIDWQTFARSFGISSMVVSNGPDVAVAWARGEVMSGRPCLLLVPTLSHDARDYADPVGIASIEGS